MEWTRALVAGFQEAHWRSKKILSLKLRLGKLASQETPTKAFERVEKPPKLTSSGFISTLTTPFPIVVPHSL